MTRTRGTALLLAGLLLAGCTGVDLAGEGLIGRSDTAGEPAMPGPDAAPLDADAFDAEAPAAEPPVQDAPGPGGTPADLAASVMGRAVIRTASIELAVPDPETAFDQVTRIAERAGGFVATADLVRDDHGLLRGTITLRVPSAELLRTLDELDQLGEGAASRRIDERDVTVELSDIEARLRNLTAYERELTALLTEVREATSDPDHLLRVFERIRQVREEIDVLEGRLAVLSDQVSMATITARITPSTQGLPVADPTWRPGDTLREAVTALASALSRIADGVIWAVVVVLPVVAIAAAPVAVVAAVWRRRRRRPTPPGTPPASTPTAPAGTEA